MKNEQGSERLGQVLGEQGFDHFKELAWQVCEQEKLRLTLMNEPMIAAADAELRSRVDRHAVLENKLASNSEDSEMRVPWVRRVYALLAVLLVLGGGFFLYSALSMLGRGYDAWFMSFAMAPVFAFLVHRTLHFYRSKTLMKIMCITALLGAIAGVVTISRLRVQILLLSLLKAMNTASLSDVDSGHAFYTNIAPMLMLLTCSFSLAMEAAAGIALYHLVSASAAQHTTDLHAKEYDENLRVILDLIYRRGALRNEPAIFVATFTRDFLTGLAKGTSSKSIARWLPAVVMGVFLLMKPLAAEAHNTYVVLPDVTVSVGGTTANGSSNFAENFAALRRLIQSIPPDSTISVVAISSQSFANPDILISGEIPASPGPLPLLDQILVARQRISRQLDERIRTLKPVYEDTDVFGALKLAASIFESAADGNKTLLILSDMRQSTKEVDFETQATIDTSKIMLEVTRSQLLIPLPGVDVFVFGVDGAGRSLSYWDGLRDFWKEYFRQSQGRLRLFSPSRSMDAIFRTRKPEQ